MKKLKLLKYLAVALLLFAVGCNDLLQKPDPATSVKGEAVLTSAEGVKALRASLYSSLRASGGFTTMYFIGPSAISDETRHRSGASRYQGLNELTGNDGGTNGLAPGSGTFDTYNDTYDIINKANLMINSVKDGVLDNQATLDQYRGEAYAVRALVMHHLVRSIAYEPGHEVGGWDKGIVLRTTPTQDLSDVEEAPRATVSEVYTQILDDLDQAKSLLAGQTDNTHITEAFVDGLMARVNLYAGNWSEANTAAGNAINDAAQSLVTDSATVADMFDETGPGHPEALFKVVVNPSTEPIAGDNVNNGLAAYTSTVWVAQVPTNFVINLYDSNDYRLGWYRPCFNDRAGTPVSGCTDVNDEGWEIDKWGGEKGQQADDIPYMRISEMYLIQAEARSKMSGNTYADGMGPLNTLRQARGLNPLVTGVDITSQQEFMNEVLDARVRELVAEGHRFYDLKRLGRDITNPDGSTKIRYDSYRILDDIEADLISANGALENNPGY